MDGGKAEGMDGLIEKSEITDDAATVVVVGGVPGILNVSGIGERPRQVYSEEKKTHAQVAGRAEGCCTKRVENSSKVYVVEA